MLQLRNFLVLGICHHKSTIKHNSRFLAQKLLFQIPSLLRTVIVLSFQAFVCFSLNRYQVQQLTTHKEYKHGYAPENGKLSAMKFTVIDSTFIYSNTLCWTAAPNSYWLLTTHISQHQSESAAERY